ncbi:MAG: hypothetical protein ACKO73_07555 [Acidimicrobiaceae bacterium]
MNWRRASAWAIPTSARVHANHRKINGQRNAKQHNQSQHHMHEKSPEPEPEREQAQADAS